MLRISITKTADGETLLSLEGLVRGRFAVELSKTCEPFLADGSHLTLDLSQVTFIDAQGVAVIQDLEKRHAVICNPSSFVSEVLKGVGFDPRRRVPDSPKSAARRNGRRSSKP